VAYTAGVSTLEAQLAEERGRARRCPGQSSIGRLGRNDVVREKGCRSDQSTARASEFVIALPGRRLPLGHRLAEVGPAREPPHPQRPRQVLERLTDKPDNEAASKLPGIGNRTVARLH
jgi:hypothetical protein